MIYVAPAGDFISILTSPPSPCDLVVGPEATSEDFRSLSLSLSPLIPSCFSFCGSVAAVSFFMYEKVKEYLSQMKTRANRELQPLCESPLHCLPLCQVLVPICVPNILPGFLSTLYQWRRAEGITGRISWSTLTRCGHLLLVLLPMVIHFFFLQSAESAQRLL